MTNNRGHAIDLLNQSLEAPSGEGEQAWLLIARAQTHATLALVEAVERLTEIVKVHR